jgi:hypothetical protein
VNLWRRAGLFEHRHRHFHVLDLLSCANSEEPEPGIEPIVPI